MNIVVLFFINLIWTMLLYCSIPFLIRFFYKKPLEDKQAKGIALLFSIFIYVGLVFLYVSLYDMNTTTAPSALYPLIWYGASVYILKYTKEIKKNETGN